MGSFLQTGPGARRSRGYVRTLCFSFCFPYPHCYSFCRCSGLSESRFSWLLL